MTSVITSTESTVITIQNLLDQLNICSQDKHISINTAINLFNNITSTHFLRVFMSNPDIINSIHYYNEILLLEQNATNLNDIKHIIKKLFVESKDSIITNTQSHIISCCMHIVLHILFQKCWEFSPNENCSTNFIVEFKYIVSLIENEESIKIEL